MNRAASGTGSADVTATSCLTHRGENDRTAPGKPWPTALTGHTATPRPAAASCGAAAVTDGLTIVVVNGPPPEPPSAPLEDRGTGHGLVGMRERVRLVGGVLDTGPLPDGGFRVAARLPTTDNDSEGTP